MRTTTRTLACIAAYLAATGCVKEHTPPQLNAQAEQNAWMVSSYYDDAIRAGVATEATIYPHHFSPNGSELNELGRRDAGYIAEHFAQNGGKVNVRRAGADDTLYDARVKAVSEAIAAAGMPADRLSIADGHPGGNGLGAERALLVLTRDPKRLESIVSTTGTSSSSSK